MPSPRPGPQLFHRLLPLFLVVLGLRSTAAPTAPENPAETVTLRLTRAFDAAWDRNDRAAMYVMLDPGCVFQSPFQRRIGRDEIRDTVFPNTRKFRDSHNTEESSRIEGDLAYSFGTLTCNHYNKAGVMTSHITASQLYIFSRRPGQDWKIRFLITLKETEEKIPVPAS